jgi:hypothetical protein
MVFLGDVHGKWRELESILVEYRGDQVVQVGDFGLGFPERPREGKDPENLGPHFKFIRGNHDNPEVCRLHPNYLGDFGITDYGLAYLSGAWSIDFARRTPGIDWWDEEELKSSKLQLFIDMFKREKPEFMVSHDAPYFLYDRLVRSSFKNKSRTTMALQEAFESHKPKFWVFGHHHLSMRERIKGTEFVCLDELETLDTSWL